MKVIGGSREKIQLCPPSSLAIDFPPSNEERNLDIGKHIKFPLKPNVWIRHMVWPLAECLDPPLNDVCALQEGLHQQSDTD